MSCGNGSCGCGHDDTSAVVTDEMKDGCCGWGCCSHDDGAMQVELSPEQIEMLSRLLDENNEELTDEEIEQVRALLFPQQA